MDQDPRTVFFNESHLKLSSEGPDPADTGMKPPRQPRGPLPESEVGDGTGF